MTGPAAIVLLTSLLETFDVDTKASKESIALRAVNRWLASEGWSPLVYVSSPKPELCFLASVYLTHLDRRRIQTFVKIVRSQEWERPAVIQILVKDPGDGPFRSC